MSRSTRRIVAGLIVGAHLCVVPATAAASPDDLVREVTAGSSQYPDAVGYAMDGLLGALDMAGYGNLPVPKSFVEATPDYPFATDAAITEPEVVAREVEGGRLERWSVASPAMQRVVEVQVYRALDPDAPAPQLFLLDGVSGTDNAGWVREGYVQDAFADENVTVIMPKQATGSMHTGWQQEDPALGHMKWETFLTSELAPLMAAEKSLNYNNHRGIGGLSMGAAAAVRIANRNPLLFDAAIGISGC
ncbi:alpha/beta hydrolase [Corynebacterium sp. A21]|uniref:alpha/beta hydrolase n=1 Tax=Corynebacterium sp. A21 TaxID=3457318 RepID=UPI003FD212F2